MSTRYVWEKKEAEVTFKSSKLSGTLKLFDDVHYEITDYEEDYTTGKIKVNAYVKRVRTKTTGSFPNRWWPYEPETLMSSLYSGGTWEQGDSGASGFGVSKREGNVTFGSNVTKVSAASKSKYPENGARGGNYQLITFIPALIAAAVRKGAA